MVALGLAVPYARQRFQQHRQGVHDALALGLDADVKPLRNLAAYADASVLA